MSQYLYYSTLWKEWAFDMTSASRKVRLYRHRNEEFQFALILTNSNFRNALTVCTSRWWHVKLSSRNKTVSAPETARSGPCLHSAPPPQNLSPNSLVLLVLPQKERFSYLLVVMARLRRALSWTLRINLTLSFHASGTRLPFARWMDTTPAPQHYVTFIRLSKGMLSIYIWTCYDSCFQNLKGLDLLCFWTLSVVRNSEY
jgi:hypothetical protein